MDYKTKYYKYKAKYLNAKTQLGGGCLIPTNIAPKSTDIKECFPHIGNMQETTVPNPLGKTETCQLLTSKKLSYYKYTNDPKSIIAAINNVADESPYKKNLLGSITDIFDITNVRENCCNCISISLYSTAIKHLPQYLFSIKRTIQNVVNSLPDFIVRLYLDMSVYRTIIYEEYAQKIDSQEEYNARMNESLDAFVARMTVIKNNVNLGYPFHMSQDQVYSIFAEPVDIDQLKKLHQQDKEDYSKTYFAEMAEIDRRLKLVDLVNFIFNAENVEVYTYICDSIPRKISYEKTRTFRFLPFTDKNVNVCIVRDADGTVTNLDCHNIKVFMQSPVLFYSVPLHGIENDHYDHIGERSYSNWLERYKTLGAYFKTKQNLFDMLAGNIGFKLYVKETKYNECINELALAKYENLHKMHPNGYDEILLAHLFKDIITVNSKDSSYNKYIDFIYTHKNRFKTVDCKNMDKYSGAISNQAEYEKVKKMMGSYYGNIDSFHSWNAILGKPKHLDMLYGNYLKPEMINNMAILNTQYINNIIVNLSKLLNTTFLINNYVQKFREVYVQLLAHDYGALLQDKVNSMIRCTEDQEYRCFKENFFPGMSLVNVYIIDALLSKMNLTNEFINVAHILNNVSILSLLNIPYVATRYAPNGDYAMTNRWSFDAPLVYDKIYEICKT